MAKKKTPRVRPLEGVLSLNPRATALAKRARDNRTAQESRGMIYGPETDANYSDANFVAQDEFETTVEAARAVRDAAQAVYDQEVRAAYERAKTRREMLIRRDAR